ncbi:MAG TPA: adenosylcobinamide-GDP ribazoletransferase [Pilimelia sp.]|nr:adenosylcobinamide-GDP ribazoletransferase [Pilimelia sp.]
MRLPDAVLLGVGTLTALPVPPPRRVDRRTAGRAMLLAPLASTPVAAAGVAVLSASVAAGLDPLVAATAAVAATALATRGLHLDGLADTADALACGGDRSRALAVMRRGDTGPAGAAATVLVLLLQVTALAQATAAGRGGLAVAVAVVSSRAVLAPLCARGVPAARGEGLGATVAGSVPPAAAAVALLAAAAGLAALSAVTGAGPGRGAVALAAAAAAAGAVLAVARRRVGGVTGDVLGAAVELAATGALLALAAG